MIASLILLAACMLLHIANARDVLELQGVNFELALTSYKYIAVAFHDNSDFGESMHKNWVEAAQLIRDFEPDSEIATIASDDKDLQELVDAYGLSLPCIRVFRRGVMADYRGPFDNAEAIANFLVKDAEPSVKYVEAIEDIRHIFDKNTDTFVFGLFRGHDLIESEGMEGYSIDPWGQFQAVADALRGHAHFYVTSSTEIMDSFQISQNELPLIYMLSSDGEGFLQYPGEILEKNLSGWILRNSAPSMGELTITTAAGEQYATQFFSSRKLKFILFITPSMLSSGVLDSWRSLSEVFKGEAIFSYMTQNSVADVVEYFSIDVDKDVPIIAAHQPSTDSKYKSKRLDLTKLEAMQDFVAGVITEKVARVMKSEPIPKKSTRPVIVAVGSSVVDLVSQEEKDVLLVVYTPWCQNCRGLLPTYDILGRAVQGEERIIVAKIDATANDIPISWKVKSDPTILWFPAKDKPYKNDVPVARNYWDAGFSLIELVGFIQREGSFDSSTLKIATMEQLSFLQTDEDAAREKYILEELQFKRNEGRKIYDNQLLDFFDGEIVFDGKRWHLLVALIVSVWCIGSTVFGLTTLAGLKSPTSRKKNK